MGKYMRKAKISGEVAVMELAQSSLGVRTRAKTLALQRLQKTTIATPSSRPTTRPSTTTTTTTKTTTSPLSDSCYLQLRSRRLEKPPQLFTPTSEPPRKQNPNSRPNSSNSANLGPVGVSITCSKNEEEVRSVNLVGDKQEQQYEKGKEDLGVEGSFGENFLDIEGRERSTRETTPCSLIRGSETVGTPGSTTRPTNSSAASRRIQNAVRRNIPTTHEMEEFFAGAEQQQQRIFTEKYNFDPVSESPLPGRYEWERVGP
ncbi:hypothetical protein Sjap_008879 [Stephania japonica]|uniref:Cyclin-dependent kinase inhibitor domain-containing protein n=1 Tax=Stephania japonica TaxID=461633 RepID=A0AAP0JSQ0_9MAGN